MASKDVPERGLSQEPSGPTSVRDVGHGYDGIEDAEVDNGIHVYRHTVPGKDL